MGRPRLPYRRPNLPPPSPASLSSASPGWNKMLYMGNRIVRCCVLVALAIVLLILVHAMIDFTREDCLASMDMGHEPIDAEGLRLELHHKVNLEMFVMSKCPDAVDAEAVLVTVMQNVGHKVSLNFTYIASLNNDSQSPQLICKHGATECMGNKQQLCFQKHHSSRILPFISCLNRSPSQIGNSLSHALHCADRTKVSDFTTVIQPCAESQDGEDLLVASAKRCDQLNTHTSATIRIAGKNVCVRDGGVWKDCREVLSLGGGDVTLGLEKLIDKEWNKGPPGRLFWQIGRWD